MMRRAAILLLAGTALAPWPGVMIAAHAEDVTVNLDALGPEPAKKPAAKPAAPAVEDAAPRPKPMAIDVPASPTQPKLTPKPAAAAAPAPKGEIDFIGRTKRATGAPEETAPPPSKSAAPKPQTRPAAPVMSATVPDEPVAPAPPKLAAPIAAPAVKPAAARKKENPATVVVNTGGLEGEAAPGARPKGTPLTEIQPDGVLYVPKNIEALPQPVSVPASAQPVESEAKPLTLPPAHPEAPPVEPAADPAAPAPARPSAMALPRAQPPATALPPAQPPSTQAVAAVAPAAPAKPAAPQERASVLAGQATAVEVKFEAGLEVLTPEAQAALDQIAEPLKAAGLRVQLAAYSGPPGNNSSDTRRLSLKRALAVREYLATRGVPQLTVNIAAFGGAVQGDTDRVDVMVRTDQVGRLAPAQ